MHTQLKRRILLISQTGGSVNVNGLHNTRALHTVLPTIYTERSYIIMNSVGCENGTLTQSTKQKEKQHMCLSA